MINNGSMELAAQASANTALTEIQKQKWQAILSEYNKEKRTWLGSTEIIRELTQHFQNNRDDWKGLTMYPNHFHYTKTLELALREFHQFR